MIDETLRSTMRDFTERYDVHGLLKLDAEESSPERVRDALLQLPFLVEKQLIVVYRPFIKKPIYEAIVDAMDAIPEQNDVILVEASPDKRTTLFKRLLASHSIREHNKLSSPELIEWVQQYAQNHGSYIAPSEAKHLIARVGDSQMIIAREIEKLSVSKSIERDAIDLQTEQHIESSVFDMLDAVCSGQTGSATKRYEELCHSGVDPHEILAMIGWQLSVLAKVQSAQIEAVNLRSVGLSPYVVQKATSALSKISRSSLKSAISKTLKTDLLIKTSPVEPEDAVKLLILDLF